ncbi:MAG: hypothetical protein K2N06_05480 [Oscillospiraceae bacterium]|nr:hypothetical protein [Oscillospiraceae bacterium]
MTISELCTELNNWFEREVKSGTFTIHDGVLDVDFLLNNQYFRVIGSLFNDGVHKFSEDKLSDETFSGEVWCMAVPPDVISLAADINDWIDKYAEAVNSPYSSESFAGYSYALQTVSSGSDAESAGLTWQAKFRSRLNRWRKL